MFFITFFDLFFCKKNKVYHNWYICIKWENKFKRNVYLYKKKMFNRLSLVFIYFSYFCSVNSTDIEKILISTDNKWTRCQKEDLK